MSLFFLNAVIRADNDTIEIGENTKCSRRRCYSIPIQDTPVSIGKNVTIGHNAMFHGRSIGENSVIAIGAVVLSNAVIGKNCMIAANALVLESQTIPDASLVIGIGKIKASLSEQQIEAMKKYSQHYLEKIQRFKHGLKVFDPRTKPATQ